MVDTHPYKIECAARIIAWDIHHTGLCLLKMQVWAQVGTAFNMYKLLAENSISIGSSDSRGVRISRFSISDQSQQIYLSVGSTIYFGITSMSNSCYIKRLNGSHNLVYINYRPATSSVPVNTSSFSRTEYMQADSMPAFRAILEIEGKCVCVCACE